MMCVACVSVQREAEEVDGPDRHTGEWAARAIQRTRSSFEDPCRIRGDCSAAIGSHLHRVQRAEVRCQWRT